MTTETKGASEDSILAVIDFLGLERKSSSSKDDCAGGACIRCHDRLVRLPPATLPLRSRLALQGNMNDCHLGGQSMKHAIAIAACLLLGGCASANTIQTSKNTAIVSSSAAPACGGIGAARVAQRQAAVATLKAGYDSYVIQDAASENTVHVVQTPGIYNTTAVANGNFVTATTTYQPGVPIVTGRRGQAFAVRMFKDGEPGSENALSARDALGPDWQKKMNEVVMTCTNS